MIACLLVRTTAGYCCVELQCEDCPQKSVHRFVMEYIVLENIGSQDHLGLVERTHMTWQVCTHVTCPVSNQSTKSRNPVNRTCLNTAHMPDEGVLLGQVSRFGDSVFPCGMSHAVVRSKTWQRCRPYDCKYTPLRRDN